MIDEYAEMHYMFGFCDGNARAAAREYRTRYPGRERYLDYRVFQNVHRWYIEGKISGNPQREGRPWLDIVYKCSWYVKTFGISEVHGAPYFEKEPIVFFLPAVCASSFTH